MKTILIRDGTLVTSTEQLQVDVLIHNGIIAKLAFHDSPTYALPAISDAPVEEVIEAEGLLLFPSLIDCHVHFREPGLTQKGDMKTESTAARAGGVGTVCEMPNTVPPTVTVAALADKVRRAEASAECDMRFFFGVTEAAHLQAVRELWTGSSEELQRLKAHCCGVKIYMDHSTGDQKIQAELLEDVFKTCAELAIPLVAHCEDSELNRQAAEGIVGAETNVALHSHMRPPASEERAIAMALSLVRKYRAPFHVAHLSTKQGLYLVRQAKANKLPVTCEVAPHHLFLSEEDYELLETLAKMNPPLRSRDHCEALWEGIQDGTIDCISTDHAPHTLEEKRVEDPSKAPSGVPGVETMVPLLLSVAAGRFPHKDIEVHFSYSDILRLCFENPNRIFRLGKEGIVEGAPGDLILVDPKEEWTIDAKNLHYKCGWTPYEGWKIKGKVLRSISY